MKDKESLKLYQCEVIDYCNYGVTDVAVRDFIQAQNEEEAKEVFCRQNNLRKNKKGLSIEEIPYVEGEKIRKIETKEVTIKEWNYWLGEYEDTVYKDVLVHYCSKCGKKTRYTKSGFCYYCGADLR